VVERHIFLLKSLTNCDAMVWRGGHRAPRDPLFSLFLLVWRVADDRSASMFPDTYKFR
jgi:hypothetical protein